MSEQMQPLSGAGGQGMAETGPLVHLHFAPSRMLWRIGPAWAVVAGAVAAGAPLGNAVSLLRLATAVILADLVWGILRRIIPDSPGTEGTATLRAPSLPYGRSDAPLARVMQTVASGQHASTAPWLGWLGGLALTVVLSLLLGAPTLLISAAAVGLIFLTRALFRRGACPSFCLALLDVGLPWALGAALVWPDVDGEAQGLVLADGDGGGGVYRSAVGFVSRSVFRRAASGCPVLWTGDAPWRPGPTAPTVGCRCGGAVARAADLVVGAARRG